MSKTDHNGVSNKQRIWLGLPGGGGLGTASKVLQAAGIPYEDIAELGKGLRLGYDAATNRLLDAGRDKEGALWGDALLAYFRTMAVPKPSGKSAARITVERLLGKDAQLLSLQPELIDRLEHEFDS